MSFRKRNVAISGNKVSSEGQLPTKNDKIQLPGVRPSAVDGRPVTSTGNTTLDGLFTGHGGLILGTSILIEESGTTDYGGALLRMYAAEGLLQGHHVHVVGIPDQWGRELPGLAKESDGQKESRQASEKMKIAWRYERLGQFETDSGTRDRGSKAGISQSQTSSESTPQAFCHNFDLAKRLVHPPASQINFLTLDRNPSRSPFEVVLGKLSSILISSPPNSVHRVVVPSLLSPAIYPPHSSLSHHLFAFQHGLRALLSSYRERMTIFQSLPLSLYPRSCGLTRWIELIADGVLELTPFPHSADVDVPGSRDTSAKEEPPQGVLRLHRLPGFHEQGVGVPPIEVDWTFSLSRRKFTIKPFNLPPIEGDSEAQQAGQGENKANKSEIEF